jgi:hypothetical protein
MRIPAKRRCAPKKEPAWKNGFREPFSLFGHFQISAENNSLFQK